MAAQEASTAFVIFGPIAMGAIIGLLELIFVHSDEQGMGWFTHGLHGVLVAWILVFVSMNIGPVSALVGYPLEESFWVNLAVRVGIGIIAMIKVKSAAAIAGKASSFGEKFWHAAVIGILIAGCPYVWPFAEPFIPAWLNWTISF